MDKEKVANLCHEQWIGWMKYFFSKCDIIPAKEIYSKSNAYSVLVIPPHYRENLYRLMNTSYENLSEKEKDSDRKEANKFLKLWRKS